MARCTLEGTNHWCGSHRPTSGLGLGPGFFCHDPHPDPKYLMKVAGRQDPVPSVRCMRIAGHEGDHSAYTFSVHTPDTWQSAPPF